MKKLFLLMAVVCTAVATHAQNLLGEWNATKMIMFDESGAKVTMSVTATKGSIRIIFQENNQIILSVDGESQQGTYQLADGTLLVTIDGETVPFPVRFTDDNTFEMDWSQLGGKNLIFVLEKANASTTSRPVVEEYTGPVNLIGSWTATEVTTIIEGVEVNVDLSQLQISIAISFQDNNQVVFSMNGEVEKGTYQLNGNQLTLIFSENTETCPIKFITADKFEWDLTEKIGEKGLFVFERQ